MSFSPDNLNESIKFSHYPSELPLALPPTHVTVARWFKSIVSEGELKPRVCSVFGKELLYFFYGGVFYRTSHNPTENACELPISFVFSPEILNVFENYYPFDTGAVASNRFGSWNSRLADFKEQFKVLGDGGYEVPRKIIHRLYGNNTNYLEGKIDSKCQIENPPLPFLFEFMTEDFTKLGVDHRKYVIECQSHMPIKLDRNLLWIGFPESMTPEFITLLNRMQPYIPDYYTYKHHTVFRPSEVIAQLETRAYDIIKRFEKLPGI